jgi:23S rRNA (cytosine1962-C5)-methyltransferase
MEPNRLSRIPEPADRAIAVRVTPAAERALRQGHPWLFDQAIRDQRHAGRPGDLAVIFDRRRRFLAVGLYDPNSPIRVRILQQREPAAIDRDWFEDRLAAAVRVREPLLQGDTTGYRLVHGENDGLPGLVIDRYDQTSVLKLYTAAWVPHLRHVLPALAAVAPAERLILRLGDAVQTQPQDLHGLRDGTILFGPGLDGSVVFQENGLRFEADPIHGQKTGFFLDQRDNRAHVEKLAAGKTVLDVFSYTGGFSLYAARGGARAVVSLDASRPALAAAARNFALNQDQGAVATAKDLVIVDPPAFAKKQDQVARALMAYGKLTHLGLGVLQAGGILVLASCSSRVSAESFFATVNRAAVQAGRPLHEIERAGHPLDHPVGFPEGAYLKCLFASAP